MALRVGSLFSGAGLCDLGLSWAGLDHQWFCEIDPFCRSILKKHWPHVPVFEDVRELGWDCPAVDVLCGGFPCQDVSCAGKKAGIKEGTRSGLWIEYMRLIKEIHPKYAIIENVRGLLSCGIEIVLEDLAAFGYDAEWEVLPAAAFGAPHHRERVFIVAYPDSFKHDRIYRLLSPLRAVLGNVQQSFRVADWLGIRIDRSSRQAIRKAYPGCVVRRVDDGFAKGMDLPPGVRLLPREDLPVWIQRLKSLGNGIVPYQAWAIAMCILTAEGLPAGSLPDMNSSR